MAVSKDPLSIRPAAIPEALVKAILPVIEAHGGKFLCDNSAAYERREAQVLCELRRLVPEITVKDAVATHALLTSAAESEADAEGPTYEALYTIYRLLEDFICRADATSAGDVLARFEFFKKANDEDDISDDNVAEYLNSLGRDLRCLASGRFATCGDVGRHKFRPHAQRLGEWSHRYESR